MRPSYGHPDNYKDKPVARYVDIFVDMVKHLPKGLTVTDLFGGNGTVAKAMWPVLEPESWISYEIDPHLVETNVEPRVTAFVGDAFQVKEFGRLVIIDPERGTLNSMNKDPEWQRLLMRICESPRTKYLLLQEYGAYWCHLPNQKPLYEALSGGREINKDNYKELFAEKMRDWYDWSCTDKRVGLGSSYYLFEVNK